MRHHINKKKIINDPVYGFIAIPSDLIFELIDHPYFQRLRYIKQLGLTDLIYPGALHTRFHHAIGALHLMGQVLDNLRIKGVEINNAEYEAAQIAILLHDIGHGPFSHTLEETFLNGIKHESLSYIFLKELNTKLSGALDMAIQIFQGTYPRKFFHQLISSQLDIDRLDYLTRDCFFTGVSEGSIGVDRIITMMAVFEDELMIEEKGIYSIENFLNTRRLMYWQVYLHKTTVSAERMLINLIKRAQYLTQSGEALVCSEALKLFLNNSFTIDNFKQKKVLDHFGKLDDNDIWGAIKLWQNHSDRILATLCQMLLQRNLFRVTLTNGPIQKEKIELVRSGIAKTYNLLGKDTIYLFSQGMVTNEAYVSEGRGIKIISVNGEVNEITSTSNLPHIKALSKIIKKSYLCRPKNVSLDRLSL